MLARRIIWNPGGPGDIGKKICFRKSKSFLEQVFLMLVPICIWFTFWRHKSRHPYESSWYPRLNPGLCWLISCLYQGVEILFISKSTLFEYKLIIANSTETKQPTKTTISIQHPAFIHFPSLWRIQNSVKAWGLTLKTAWRDRTPASTTACLKLSGQSKKPRKTEFR